MINDSRCSCLGCEAETPHKNKCRRKPRWYIDVHQVDKCTTAAPVRINVCQQCFDSHIDLAIRTIDDGMAGGRSTFCGDCNRPLVRLSAIIRDVGKI